jgi:hypothetical protein
MGCLPFLLGLFACSTVGARARLRLGDLDRAVVDARRAASDIVRLRVLQEVDIVALLETVEALMRTARLAPMSAE